ncbi:hypothetical protein [Azospirillum picis]|uniref:Uncharacterized protein n=1 Tax=Azospirillum picis TaxID=488438 RepID=A0ABU0MK25_9PROT|nr:hypothetical protein [Azospirillum picis]MBP2299945.1 hypothetical protein [Azospirillum picis]MDQ0533817.1 hypothetical protein [Azospirillum picis]
MATRRLDREDHVRRYLAQMLEGWQEQTGRDMATAMADQRMQHCTTLLIDLLGEAERADEAAAIES